MDTLKILQKLYRLGRILSKIAYVCAIVAACLCAGGRALPSVPGHCGSAA